MSRIIRITNNVTDRYLTQQAGDRAAGIVTAIALLWFVVAPLVQQYFGG